MKKKKRLRLTKAIVRHAIVFSKLNSEIRSQTLEFECCLISVQDDDLSEQAEDMDLESEDFEYNDNDDSKTHS